MIKQPKARLGIISKETKGDIRARVIPFVFVIGTVNGEF